MSAPYTDVLKDIEEFYVENSVKAYAPTVDKHYQFKPISVTQMKELIEIQVKASKDETNVMTSLETVNALNKLLIDNYVGDNAEELIHKLTIVDRDAIIVQLRVDNNSTLEVPNQDEDGTQEVSIAHVPKVISKNKISKSTVSCEKKVKFKSGEIKIKLKIPDLRNDSRINAYFQNQITPLIQKGKKSVKDNIEKILSQTYFVELSKYIDFLEIIKDKKTSTVLKFDNVETLTHELKLLEKLPATVITQINDFIKSIRNYRESVLYYVDDDNKQHPLTVDVSLFTTI